MQIKVSDPSPATRMERLWSRAVATGGSAWQMTHPRTPLKQAETVAVGCDRLPRKCHGKSLWPWRDAAYGVKMAAGCLRRRPLLGS